MFNIGIIGCGKIAQVRHIPEYAAHPAARLTGYYDLNLSGPRPWPPSGAAGPTPPGRRCWPTRPSTR